MVFQLINECADPKECSFHCLVLFLFDWTECTSRLGVVTGEIGSIQMSASSSEKHYSGPTFGRLHSSLGQGAWCAATQDSDQYLQVGTCSRRWYSSFRSRNCAQSN